MEDRRGDTGRSRSDSKVGFSLSLVLLRSFMFLILGCFSWLVRSGLVVNWERNQKLLEKRLKCVILNLC